MQPARLTDLRDPGIPGLFRRRRVGKKGGFRKTGLCSCRLLWGQSRLCSAGHIPDVIKKFVRAVLRAYARNTDDQSICTALRQRAVQSTAHYDAVLAPSGIKVAIFRLLGRIAAAQSISITELAEIVGLDGSTLGRNLCVLERQSLVAGGTGKDGRARSVSLTETRRKTLLEAVPPWQTAQREFSKITGADALSVLDRAIERTGKREQAIGDSA